MRWKPSLDYLLSVILSVSSSDHLFFPHLLWLSLEAQICASPCSLSKRIVLSTNFSAWKLRPRVEASASNLLYSWKDLRTNLYDYKQQKLTQARQTEKIYWQFHQKAQNGWKNCRTKWVGSQIHSQVHTIGTAGPSALASAHHSTVYSKSCMTKAHKNSN